MTIKQVAVIGASSSVCSKELYEFGVQLGTLLGDLGKIVLNGGRDGTMEAVFKGVHQSKNYRYGMTIGITPFQEKIGYNEYCDIVLPTGIGYTRNSIVANSGDLVIALGGGSGTMNEIAFAWTWGKPILALVGFGGWSEKLAGQALDDRRGNDIIIPVRNLEEIKAQIDLIEKGL
jgi:uncharacterized protein (TIGR00725 family)